MKVKKKREKKMEKKQATPLKKKQLPSLLSFGGRGSRSVGRPISSQTWCPVMQRLKNFIFFFIFEGKMPSTFFQPHPHPPVDSSRNCRFWYSRGLYTMCVSVRALRFIFVGIFEGEDIFYWIFSPAILESVLIIGSRGTEAGAFWPEG